MATLYTWMGAEFFKSSSCQNTSAAGDRSDSTTRRARLELKGETENGGIRAKERTSVKAVVLMATTCTKSPGGGSGKRKQQKGSEARRACSKYCRPAFLGRDQTVVSADECGALQPSLP